MSLGRGGVLCAEGGGGPSGVHHSPEGRSERPGRNGTSGPPISLMATICPRAPRHRPERRRRGCLRGGRARRRAASALCDAAARACQAEPEGKEPLTLANPRLDGQQHRAYGQARSAHPACEWRGARDAWRGAAPRQESRGPSTRGPGAWPSPSPDASAPARIAPQAMCEQQRHFVSHLR